MSRHAVRVVRIAGTIVGTVRTVSGSDAAVAAPPAFAMTSRGRALIAYATTSGRIRLVTERAVASGRELAADLRQRALLGLVEDRERALDARGVLGEEPVHELLAEAVSATVAARRSCARRLRTTSPRCSSVVTTSVAFALDV